MERVRGMRTGCIGATLMLAALMGCGGGGGGGGGSVEPPATLALLAVAPADGAVLADAPAQASVTFDAPIDAKTLPADALMVLTRDGLPLVGSVELAPDDPRTVVLHFAAGSRPAPGDAYQLCISDGIEALDGRSASPMCFAFSVIGADATVLAAGGGRIITEEGSGMLGGLAQAPGGGFALLFQRQLGDVLRPQAAWLDAADGAWFAGPDLDPAGGAVQQLAVDGTGVLHAIDQFGVVQSMDRHGELMSGFVAEGHLVRTFDGAVDVWTRYAFDGGVATSRYNAAQHAWLGSTAVDSYELQADDHAAAPFGRLHHGRLAAGPLGALRLVVDERARSGRVMRTTIIETGLVAASALDVPWLTMRAGVDGRALAVVQLLRPASAGAGTMCTRLGVVAFDPATGWGAFEMLAAGEQSIGCFVDVQLAGSHAALFCRGGIGAGMDFFVRDAEGRWTRERDEYGSYWPTGLPVGAIDDEGNLLYATQTLGGLECELRARKSGRGWSGMRTLVELGVQDATPAMHVSRTLHALGGGRFLFVWSQWPMSGPAARIASCVVELR